MSSLPNFYWIVSKCNYKSKDSYFCPLWFFHILVSYSGNIALQLLFSWKMFSWLKCLTPHKRLLTILLNCSNTLYDDLPNPHMSYLARTPPIPLEVLKIKEHVMIKTDLLIFIIITHCTFSFMCYCYSLNLSIWSFRKKNINIV